MRISAAAFSAKKTAALPLVAGDEKKQRHCRYRYRKSSGASSAAGPITANKHNVYNHGQHVFLVKKLTWPKYIASVAMAQTILHCTRNFALHSAKCNAKSSAPSPHQPELLLDYCKFEHF